MIDCPMCNFDQDGGSRHDPACPMRSLPARAGTAPERLNGAQAEPRTVDVGADADTLSAAYAEALERARAFATL
ncbi:MAG TPA: hypothetical protein VMK84_23695 [Streptosporangiaceae bacterium]|nr:hypothetical protein [Streptosporangiaceae bacterium]